MYHPAIMVNPNLDLLIKIFLMHWKRQYPGRLTAGVLIPTIFARFSASPPRAAVIDWMLRSKMNYLIRRGESGRGTELKGWHHLYRKPLETALDQLATVSADAEHLYWPNINTPLYNNSAKYALCYISYHTDNQPVHNEREKEILFFYLLLYSLLLKSVCLFTFSFRKH